MIKNVTLGSDPEFGVIDINTNEPKSVIGLLGGTKKRPLDIGKGCSRQEDNVGAEVCIPPTNNSDEFVKSIMYAKQECSNLLREHSLKLVSASSFNYSREELNNPKAMEFGCEPSFCAYTQSTSPRPHPNDVGGLRSFGFHIHIGFDGIAEMETIENLIFAMDICCGLPSILIDGDTERRKLYGNAGDFRFKHLVEKNITIVEYRSLGGNMHGTEETIKYIFNQTLKAVDMANNWNVELFERYKNDIQFAIDNDDKQIATALLNSFNIEVPNYIICNEIITEKEKVNV